MIIINNWIKESNIKRKLKYEEKRKYKVMEKQLETSVQKLKGARNKRFEQRFLQVQQSCDPNFYTASLDVSYPFANRQSLDFSSLSSSIDCNIKPRLNNYYSLEPSNNQRNKTVHKAQLFLPMLTNNENSVQNLSNQAFIDSSKDQKLQTLDLKSIRMKLKEEAAQNAK